MSETPPRHVGTLNRRHVLPAVAARKSWCVTPPAGALPDDLCMPEYWKHIVTELGMKSNDLVDATCEDGTWYATYLIIHIGQQHAKLQLLEAYSLVEMTDLAKQTDTHEIKWKGPAHMYVVSRLSDGETIKHGFESAAAAATWMHQNADVIAA